MGALIDTVDVDSLERDLNTLADELRADVGPEDLTHLRRVALFGRAMSLIGWATSWIAPNPLSAIAMSLGITGRWTMIAHHVTHRGYDKVPDVPARYTSKVFAVGWRRFIDWMDVIDPEAWKHEHNTLHHYKLGEIWDPDQPEHNMEWLRNSKLPIWLRYIVVFLGATTWRWLYYPTNTMNALYEAQQRRAKEDPPELSIFESRAWNPFQQPGRMLWMRCWLPYAFVRFGLLPLPFLAIGTWAWAFSLMNMVLAEFLANIHTFMIIVPSHAGEDLLRFDEPITGRGDFYFRQIAGSANYRTGGFFNDYMHGYLNYQIEHHVWPDMTMRQYVRSQPKVKAICEAHGMPYIQESVFARTRRLLRVMVGTETMPHSTGVAPAAAAAAE